MKQNILWLFLISLLIGCFSSDLEKEMLKHDDNSLLGKDLNQNSIRDDIEIFIAAKYFDKKHRNLLAAYSSVARRMLRFCERKISKEKLDQLDSESKRIIGCYNSLFISRYPSYRDLEYIDSLITNNKTRRACQKLIEKTIFSKVKVYSGMIDQNRDCNYQYKIERKI